MVLIALLTASSAAASPTFAVTYVAGSGGLDAGAASDSNVCNSESSPCATLAGALSQTSSAGTVELSGTLTEASATSVDQNVTIEANPDGSSAIVEGSSDTSGLLTVGGYAITVTGITFLDGNNNDSSDTGGGGAITNNSGGTLTVDHSTFTGNTAAYSGGAIANGSGGSSSSGATGTLVVTDSAFSGNTASYSYGAAIANGTYGHGIATITDSTFSGNHMDADGGGTIDNGSDGSGTLTVSDSTFAQNLTGGAGGGIGSWGGSNVLTTVSDSTFSGNTAAYGGAMFSSGINNAMVVTDSTFTGNSANNSGGAIENALDISSNLTVTASTLIGNTAPQGSSIDAGTIGGAGHNYVAADVIDGTCDSGAGIAWTDDGYNAVADDSCLGGLAATGDVTGTSSSDVGTLANNGGPTQTIELLAGNPAINLIPYGTAFTVPAGSSTVTVACPVRSDQRGVANAGANGCDAGAIQYATQSASFSAPTSAIVGQAAAALSGSSSSSLPLSYSVDPSTTHSACSVSADKVSFIHAGTCVLDGNQSGDDNYSAAATVQRSLAVSPAQTSTAVTVGSSAVRATVTAAPPGGGTPGGTVRFTTGGQVLGSVALVSGVATLDYTVPANTTEQITASYQGNSDYLGSSGAANGSGVTVASGGGLQYSRAANPSIKAKLHSAEPRNAKGWWRTPVTISFTCKTRGSQLIGGCPKAVTLRQSGKRLSVTRAIRAKNGGRAKVTVSGIAIDLTRPKVAIAGPKPHVSYRISSPAAHCVAHDRVSGVQACRLTHRITDTASGVTITYLARVTSNAGTTSVTSEKVRVSTIALLGAARSDGAYRVIPGATYALEVLSRSKPRYIDAAVAPLAPSGVQDYFVTHGKVVGMTVWRLEVRIEPGLGDYRLWNIGVRVGGTTHTLLLQT